jgi:predicted NAD/FAD-binding protein
MKIAVVGSGISGLACAWLLSRRHEVVLFEQGSHSGGHTHTFAVPTPAGEQPVDTGFIVYNEINYPRLTALFRELGVETADSDMSFGVSLGEGVYEYAGDNFGTLFLQASNILSAAHWRMLIEILRFNSKTKALLAADVLPAGTLGEFLDAQGFGQELRTRYLLPMAGAIWSCSTRQALDYPYASFARFFESHGLLNAIDRPQWKFVKGGSRRYVEKLLADFATFKGELRLNAPVTRVRRQPEAVWIATAAGEERFDAVVSAAHADQVLDFLADTDDAERRVLGAIRYASNTAYLHTDESLLPKRRAAWSSWNYMGKTDQVSDDRIPITYWMNRLQGIPGPVNYIVSLNPSRSPAPAKVLYETSYDHPHYTREVVTAQKALPSIQGRRRMWFCGAWTGYGFHEDGLKSALRVVSELDRSCLPQWADGLDQPAYAPADLLLSQPIAVAE